MLALEPLIGNCPVLQYLDLYGTAVTDRGLEALGKLKGLRQCYLTNTQITDARAVEQLGGLTELDELGLDETAALTGWRDWPG